MSIILTVLQSVYIIIKIPHVLLVRTPLQVKSIIYKQFTLYKARYIYANLNNDVYPVYMYIIIECHYNRSLLPI